MGGWGRKRDRQTEVETKAKKREKVRGSDGGGEGVVEYSNEESSMYVYIISYTKVLPYDIQVSMPILHLYDYVCTHTLCVDCTCCHHNCQRSPSIAMFANI